MRSKEWPNLGDFPTKSPRLTDSAHRGQQFARSGKHLPKLEKVLVPRHRNFDGLERRVIPAGYVARRLLGPPSALLAPRPRGASTPPTYQDPCGEVLGQGPGKLYRAAAVCDDMLSRYPAGILGGQEQGHVGNFVGSTQAAKRCGAGGPLLLNVWRIVKHARRCRSGQ